MKKRNDFVSNSSSSSYIVIVDNGAMCSRVGVDAEAKKGYRTYAVPNKDYGHLEFGWDVRTYETLEDKLNWCGIILLELYASCRCAELKGGVLGKKASKIVNSYEQDKEKFFKWNAMLSKVCEERLGFKINLDLDWLRPFGATSPDSEYAYIGTFDCYIDHQSDIFEAPENGRMFESEDTLYNFLAYEGSYIQGGNDNCDDYYE